MHAPGCRRARRPWWPLAIGAIAVLLICAVAAWRPWIGPTAPVAAPAAADAPAAPAAVDLPDPLALKQGARVLIFGDSWVYGSAAIVPTLGFAYVLGDAEGWDTVVDGARGSGYLRPGMDGAPYGERISHLDASLDFDLIIVEGSINDRLVPRAGYREAVTAAWDALAARYPRARIVILGPAPQVLPVESTTAHIDADLRDLASARDWWYISPIAEDWINAANYGEVIDTGAGKNHPSTGGHAYLAERLADALAAISASPEVVADAPLDDQVVTP